MKFTKEQYQKIVEEWEVAISYIDATQAIMDLLDHEDLGDIAEAAFSIANPLTREWAHEQYVEKEKKYVWQSKQGTDGEKVKRLYDAAIGITDSFMDKTEPTHNGNWITETEVKKWGYNPDMFNKEEVE